MKLLDTTLRLSASDLANHLGCKHLTELDRAVAERRRSKSEFFDPALKLLQERGFAHEAAYLGHLRQQGLEVVELPKDDTPILAAERTVEAMRSGKDVLAQATLVSGRWLGYADILRKVPVPSALGAWSYEVQDTKLSRTAKVEAVLQLCLYSHVLEELQGRLPDSMYIVSPGSPFTTHKLHVHDYLAYYRWIRGRIESAVAAPSDGHSYPEPVEKCTACHWIRVCEQQWRGDDHLSLVANISRSQRRELVERNVRTLANLATLPVPLTFRPERGSIDSLTRVRHQASIQLRGRTAGAPKYELLRPEPGRGLALLPEPSPGDLFFDLEGDPFVEEGGLEYLFGYAYVDDSGLPKYRAQWGPTRHEERAIFESFVDDVMARWKRDPKMHVYHFAPYEPAALKRLMGRHATRELEIDQMLRGGLFVDLYAVVRQGLRASVESYSIKKLEPFFAFTREVPLPDVGPAKRALEAALECCEKGQSPEIADDWRKVVEVYNQDDCFSALALRQWLERCRNESAATGSPVERPPAKDPNASDGRSEKNEATRVLRERLTSGVSEDVTRQTPEDQARVLLANLLDFHWREGKVAWWEFYRLVGLQNEDFLDESLALGGLSFVERVGGKKVPIQRYQFPPQECDLDEGDELFLPDMLGEKTKVGTVEAIDCGRGIVDIRKTGKTADLHPPAVFAHKLVPTDELAASLARIAESVAAEGVNGSGNLRAARDLLLKHRPRFEEASTGLAPHDGESNEALARRLGCEMDHGVLPIQGPPGTGKTHTGARMILALVKAGKRVGVTAVSHRVIRNLLDKVLEAAKEEKCSVRCGHKAGGTPDPDAPIAQFGDNNPALKALREGEIQVLGGTAWLWSRAEAADAVDVLFVDEAGQLSLANALAVAPAAKSLVLLGDPRQLEQPKKGSHPDGAEVSALEHLLGDALTVPLDRGLFLEQTRRLHPRICAFTSEVFYESRLHPHESNTRNLISAGPVSESGLWFLPVEHEGNANSAHEEVEAIEHLVRRVLGANPSWSDSGEAKPLRAEDVLIVAPYNAQVAGLEKRFPGMKIGTVDRFQGQEAPLVIVSMTSSSAEDAPRGMEFLYSLNRLNVATSRAKSACVLVASPRLFEPDCRTPRQMQLANALCRYRELAAVLTIR